MNAREKHLLKEQDAHDAQQRKAERLPPLILSGTVRRSHKCSRKGSQEYEIMDENNNPVIPIRDPDWRDHVVKVMITDQGKAKKQRTVICSRAMECTNDVCMHHIQHIHTAACVLECMRLPHNRVCTQNPQDRKI